MTNCKSCNKSIESYRIECAACEKPEPLSPLKQRLKEREEAVWVNA